MQIKNFLIEKDKINMIPSVNDKIHIPDFKNMFGTVYSIWNINLAYFLKNQKGDGKKIHFHVSEVKENVKKFCYEIIIQFFLELFWKGPLPKDKPSSE